MTVNTFMNPDVSLVNPRMQLFAVTPLAVSHAAKLALGCVIPSPVFPVFVIVDFSGHSHRVVVFSDGERLRSQEQVNVVRERLKQGRNAVGEYIPTGGWR